MFIRLRMKASEALTRIMFGYECSIPSDYLNRVIYNTLKTAAINGGFANELDQVCAEAFDEQTAEGYDDLLDIFVRMPKPLRELLTRYDIIHKESSFARKV